MENRFGTFGDNDSAKGLLFNQRISEIGNELIEEYNGHIANTDLHVTAEKQDAWDALKTFQTAGGTGTAITLTGVELVDGFQTTFVILASNSGAATTINAKPLYKPGTTTAPKLIAGKAATVWYNLAGGCFFIKASAEGTAVAGDVLAGKTFSNDDDTGLVGAYSNIKSIQRGTFNLPAASASEYVTINSVNPNNSILIFEYKTSSDWELLNGSIENATSILFDTRTSGTDFSVEWQVIEFNNVKSKQSGVHALGTGATSANVAISQVDMGKCLVYSTSYGTASNSGMTCGRTSAKLNSSTQLTISRYSGVLQAKTRWQVIEFN